MSSRHLLLISVGPVQDFIASARKLRDLWFGSYMLSELSKAVARHLHGQGVSLIFPSVGEGETGLLEQDSDLCVVNKILAAVPAGTSPQELITGAKEAIREQIRHYAENALEQARTVGIRINAEHFHQQVEDLGEFYAAWVPLGDDYADARGRVETLMAGRKALRDFSAPSWDGSGRRKSSLDGARESVIAEKHSEKMGLLKRGERLDTMGVIKRCYPLNRKQTPHFDDLSDVAVVPYLSCIRSNDAAVETLNELQHALRGSRFEKSGTARRHSSLPLNVYSDALFLEPKECRGSLGPGDVEDVVKCLQRLRKQVGGPDAYAAILVGDGDHMGTTIDEITTENGHRLFGKYLSQFASQVGELIESKGGSLIYSGGDDVMAYLPLHTLLECVQAVRSCFAESMDKALEAIGVAPTNLPTFSAGVAIVHHSAPLGGALAIARSAERMAKSEGGRNALAIIQNKRGGAPRSIYGKWNEIGSELSDLQALFARKALPGTLAYQLIEIGKLCGFKIETAADGSPLNAAAACAKRRLCAKDLDKEAEVIVNRLLASQRNLRELAGRVIIARQLAQSQSLASGSGPIKEEA